MSHVDFEKRPCCPVEFKGQGSQASVRQEFLIIENRGTFGVTVRGNYVSGWSMHGWNIANLMIVLKCSLHLNESSLQVKRLMKCNTKYICFLFLGSNEVLIKLDCKEKERMKNCPSHLDTWEDIRIIIKHTQKTHKNGLIKSAWKPRSLLMSRCSHL